MIGVSHANEERRRDAIPIGIHRSPAVRFLHSSEDMSVPRFQFSISTSEDIREAGVVQSESFSDAIAAISERIDAKDGDTLEVGVHGFPPARFQCVWSKKGTMQSWRPVGLLAA